MQPVSWLRPFERIARANMADQPARSRFWPVVFSLAFFPAFAAVTGTLSFGEDEAPKTKAKSPSKSKPAKKVEIFDEPADDDLDTDEDLTALVVPARFLAVSKETDRLKFSQELRGLLLEGFKDSGDSLEPARKHFDAARRIVADDPRAAYTYGIVLLAHNMPKEALEQFRAAAKQTKVPYLPALQGIAWLHLERGDSAQGLAALLDLAHRIEESREVWPPAHDKEHSSEWLGRMVGFLAGPRKSADEDAKIEKLASDVESLLTADRKKAYDHGKKAVAARYDELKVLAARPAEEVLAEAKQKREEVLAAAAAAESEAKKLEDELKDLKKPHDKQLADLSQEIRSNGTKVKSLSGDLEELEAEVEVLSIPGQYAQVRRYRGVPYAAIPRAENGQEKKARETQLNAAKQKLGSVKSSIQSAKQRMADAKKQRDDAQAEYRKATADKRLALQAAQRKSAELAARARDVAHGALTPEKLKSRVTALETYVPLYPESEKGRLLSALKSPS